MHPFVLPPYDRRESTDQPVWMADLRLDRRAILGLLASVPVFAVTSQTAGAQTVEQRGMLADITDVIVPADSMSPAASDLGIPARILDLSRAIPNYAQMIELGIGWLNAAAHQQGGTTFNGLSQSDKDGLFAAAMNSAPQTLPQVFASRLRSDCLTFYYSDPRIWPSLGLDGPIQPAGFMDHATAPRA